MIRPGRPSFATSLPAYDRRYAARSLSLPLRETQRKNFSGLAPYRKVVYNQCVVSDTPAESKARQGNGREARKPPDRAVRHRWIIAIPIIIKLIVSHGCYMVRNLAVASGRQVSSAPRALERMGGAPCPWRDCGTFASTLAADTVAAAGGFACLSDGSPFMRARASAVPAPPRAPRRRARAGPS
jgi:hypothetical protein